MRYCLAFIFMLAQSIAAFAQDDKGRIVQYLESALSDIGREVTIDGFSGALSSRARMEKLTIADANGVWLTLSDAVLDWNRLAVLKGQIEINKISAATIDVSRLPVADDAVTAEAGTFSLPELPVSVNIAEISAPRIILGETVIGTPATVAITGSVSLADGQGETKVTIKRLDGPSGLFDIDGAFSNTSRVLDLDLSLTEAKNGIVSSLLNLPDKPALELTVLGKAPIDNFAAQVELKSDGQQRLNGRVSTTANTTQTDPATENGDTKERVIEVDIAGDLTPLVAPQYQDFFGNNVRLASLVRLMPDGRTALENMSITAAALNLIGTATLSDGGLPEHFRLNGILKDPKGGKVVLPISGPETEVTQAKITASFDNNVADIWSLSGNIEGLRRDDVAMDDLDFSARGVILHGSARQVTANILARATGFKPTDPALAEALGTELSAGAQIWWQDGSPVDISNLNVDANGLTLTGSGTLDGLDSALKIKGALHAEANDISRLSGLAGQSLDGGIVADVTGEITALTGEFDLILSAVATDLGVGIPQADVALAGQSRLNISADRSTQGTNLRSANVVTNAGEANASGVWATGQSDLRFDSRIRNVGLFVSDINGPANISGQAIESASGWNLILDGTAPYTTTFNATVDLPNNADPSAKAMIAISNIGTLIPDVSGPAQIDASAKRSVNGWQIDATGNGPGNSVLTANGSISENADTASIDMGGTLSLALLNRRLAPNSLQGAAQFDLKLQGPIELTSFSGQITTNGTRLAVPNVKNALTGIDATVDLALGTARFVAASKVDSGGSLSAQGQVGLQAPYSTDVALTVKNVKISNPQLFETTANGALSLNGSLPSDLFLKGDIELDDTDILVPSTRIGGFSEIPEITHVNEPAKVRTTRDFAGLLDVTGAEQSGSTTDFGLDVRVVAGSPIFVRGRGIDAELDGQLRITGTTTEVIPQGQFDLTRGRLTILNKRLDFVEGFARFQGGLIPTLRLVAQTTSDDTQLNVIVQGPADAPEITFESDPELPGDEVLARLLFDRGISSISPFQAFQLASAVATLAGSGGLGIIEHLRQNIGIDDLDIQSDEEGDTSLRIGKYVNENIYTDVEINSKGESQINLNLDLTSTTKLRGQVGSDGSTGIGLFFEKDY